MNVKNSRGLAMEVAQTNELVRQHLRGYFAGHSYEEHVWTLGRGIEEMPRFRVAEFAPGFRIGLWVYATIGAWEARVDPRLEFVIAAPEQDLKHVELLTMTAWYHRHHQLGSGHTFPIGEPWLPGSKCEYFLVSLPYPFGPLLEVCNLPDGHLHVMWLLPITATEREFRIREGLEALEQRFDACALEYWRPLRASVV